MLTQEIKERSQILDLHFELWNQLHDKAKNCDYLTQCQKYQFCQDNKSDILQLLSYCLALGNQDNYESLTRSNEHFLVKLLAHLNILKGIKSSNELDFIKKIAFTL